VIAIAPLHTVIVAQDDIPDAYVAARTATKMGPAC
jgi:hypothetical protein